MLSQSRETDSTCGPKKRTGVLCLYGSRENLERGREMPRGDGSLPDCRGSPRSSRGALALDRVRRFEAPDENGSAAGILRIASQAGLVWNSRNVIDGHDHALENR